MVPITAKLSFIIVAFTMQLLALFWKFFIHLSLTHLKIYENKLIRPLLEYCAPVIFCSNKYILKDILAIENRCIKIISSHSKTLTRYQHNIPLINYRLKYLFLVAFFKITHKIVPIIDEILIPKRASSSVTRLGTTGGFLLGAGTGHIMAQGVVQYNDIPQQIRSLSCLKLFKTSLKAHLFTLELLHYFMWISFCLSFLVGLWIFVYELISWSDIYVLIFIFLFCQ